MATMGRKTNHIPGNNTKKLKIKDAIAVFDSLLVFNWSFMMLLLSYNGKYYANRNQNIKDNQKEIYFLVYTVSYYVIFYYKIL